MPRREPPKALRWLMAMHPDGPALVAIVDAWCARHVEPILRRRHVRRWEKRLREVQTLRARVEQVSATHGTEALLFTVDGRPANAREALGELDSIEANCRAAIADLTDCDRSRSGHKSNV